MPKEGHHYVIGHRNPDADAICAAIGYADLKHRLGETAWKAARCGNSNARIDAILQRFGVDLPVFVGDVTPRLEDVMVSDVITVPVEATCVQALELIDRYDVRALPVTHPDGSIAGLISIFQLGQYFTPKPRDLKAMRHVHTSIDNIVTALNAETTHLVDSDRIEDLYVRVGAMDIRSFGNFHESESIRAEQSIIVVGDRYDIQQKSIQAGVRLLVITGNLEIEDDVIQMARERNVCLITSPFDSASTSWIIRTASKVRPLIETECVIFNPQDKLAMVRRKATGKYAPLYLVCDDQDRFIGVFSRSDLLKPVNRELILVDHNEMAQAVAGASEVIVREIIDHHRLGSVSSEQPILVHNEPVGSTCTIVADHYQRYRLEPAQPIAGVLMSGIIADTLNLQSPTTTAKDKRLLEWLSPLADVGVEELAETIFSSGSVILTTSPEQVLKSDLKIYEEGEISYAVAQVEELGFSNFWKHADDLGAAVESLVHRQNLLFATLLVTDINTQNSLLLFKGSEEVRDNISYARLEGEDIFDMPGIVSRKKQLIPYLTGLLRGLGIAPVRGEST